MISDSRLVQMFAGARIPTYLSWFVQYANWYALQQSSLVRVIAAFGSQNAAVTRHQLQNVTSYERTVRIFSRIVRILAPWYAFTIAQTKNHAL